MVGSSELVEHLTNRAPGRNQVAREMADREMELLADGVGLPRTGLLDSYIRAGRADVSGRQRVVVVGALQPGGEHQVMLCRGTVKVLRDPERHVERDAVRSEFVRDVGA